MKGGIFPMAKRKTLLRPDREAKWQGGNTSWNITSGDCSKLNTIQKKKTSDISSVKSHLQIITVYNKNDYSLWLTLRVIPPPVPVVCTSLGGKLLTQESHRRVAIFASKTSPKQFFCSSLKMYTKIRFGWHPKPRFISLCCLRHTAFYSPTNTPQHGVVVPGQTLTPYSLYPKAVRDKYFLVPGLVPSAP